LDFLLGSACILDYTAGSCRRSRLRSRFFCLLDFRLYACRSACLVSPADYFLYICYFSACSPFLGSRFLVLFTFVSFSFSSRGLLCFLLCLVLPAVLPFCVLLLPFCCFYKHFVLPSPLYNRFSFSLISGFSAVLLSAVSRFSALFSMGRSFVLPAYTAITPPFSISHIPYISACVACLDYRFLSHFLFRFHVSLTVSIYCRHYTLRFVFYATVGHHHRMHTCTFCSFACTTCLDATWNSAVLFVFCHSFCYYHSVWSYKIPPRFVFISLVYLRFVSPYTCDFLSFLWNTVFCILFLSPFRSFWSRSSAIFCSFYYRLSFYCSPGVRFVL